MKIIPYICVLLLASPSLVDASPTKYIENYVGYTICLFNSQGEKITAIGDTETYNTQDTEFPVFLSSNCNYSTNSKEIATNGCYIVYPPLDPEPVDCK